MTLQTIGILLTAVTVSIAAIYYTLTLRYARRNQELQLETRQAQLFMGIYKTDESLEFCKMQQEMMWDWNWEDFDDFQNKYMFIGGNIEANAMLSSIFFHYEGLGVLAKRGLLNTDLVYELNGWRIISFWERYIPIVTEWRSITESPKLYEHLEWLYEEMKGIQTEKGQGYKFREYQDTMSQPS